MSILLRLIHQVAPERWGEVMAWEARFDAVERPLGVPPTRWYRCLIGADSIYTLVGEREYESLAQMEALDRIMAADPAWRAVDDDPGFKAVFVSTRYEVYQALG